MAMNPIDDDIIREDYVLRRLVFVNSAKHAYSEIMLNEHLALFGRNNAGKTASLAAIKLLLYPEVNFHKCYKKFKFRGKTGPYSMEESYEFYFPDSRSFLALEVENPEGRFCMVLYKTTNYGYGRFFIPLAYEAFRPIFWNEEDKRFNKELSVQTVSQFCKQQKGIKLNDSKNIADLIYSSYLSDPTRKRFCVLPLKDSRPESIEAFRNIYQLAFESDDTESQAMPSAIATLLEMGRSRDEERLDANLSQLNEDHARLVKRQTELGLLKNASTQFEALEAILEETQVSLNAYSCSFFALQAGLLANRAEFEPRHAEISREVAILEKSTQQLKQMIQSLRNKHSRADSALEEKIGAQNIRKKKLERAKGIIASYVSLSLNEIISVLIESVQDLDKKLADYRDENGLQRTLANNIQQRNLKRGKLNKLKSLVDDQTASIFHQISDTHTASVLNSLNTKLSQVIKSLTENDIDAIRAFTALFGQDRAGDLTMLDQTILDVPYLNYDSEEQLSTWTKDIQKLEADISKLSRDIDDQGEVKNPEDLARLIRAAEKEHGQAQKELDLVRAMGVLERDIAENTDDIEECKLTLEALKLDIESEQNKFNELNSQYVLKAQTLSDMSEQKRLFDKLDQAFKTANFTCKPVAVSSEIEPVKTIDENSGNDLHRDAVNTSKLINRLKDQLTRLERMVPHSDIDPDKIRTTYAECEHDFSLYQSAFATLDYDVDQLQREIRTHNQLVSNQLNELKESKSILTTFINTINQELNNKVVSNLSEIKLNLKTNTSFDNLMQALDKYDIQDETLLEQGFYISLSKFVENYFNKQTRRLKLKDIIESVSYQYRNSYTGEYMTKSQSGGTTSTITAFVLSVLLKRITHKFVALRMPIVVDEISTLDQHNTEAAIKQIADHGFSIFCATPSFSASVGKKVGHWILLDRAMVKEAMVNECHMNIMPNSIESFQDKLDAA